MTRNNPNIFFRKNEYNELLTIIELKKIKAS